MHMTRRAAAAAITALTALTLTTGAAQASAGAAQATTSPGYYTRDTLDLNGTWQLQESFAQYHGLPVTQNPPPFPTTQTVYVKLVKQPAAAVTSPPGNEPVYYGSYIDPATGNVNAAGELIVSPFTSPRGIVLTMWAAGNPDTGFSDAYSATFAMHGANSTALTFAGTWVDVDNNGGPASNMHRFTVGS